MTFAAAIERFAYQPVRRQLDKGMRARQMVQSLRDVTPRHDAIHGFLPDTRPLPSAWAMRLVLVLNPLERKLQRLVEEQAPAAVERAVGGRVDEARIEKVKLAAERMYRTGGRDQVFR